MFVFGRYGKRSAIVKWKLRGAEAEREIVPLTCRLVPRCLTEVEVYL